MVSATYQWSEHHVRPTYRSHIAAHASFQLNRNSRTKLLLFFLTDNWRLNWRGEEREKVFLQWIFWILWLNLNYFFHFYFYFLGKISFVVLFLLFTVFFFNIYPGNLWRLGFRQRDGWDGRATLTLCLFHPVITKLHPFSFSTVCYLFFINGVLTLSL